jgi:hypothetical protein
VYRLIPWKKKSPKLLAWQRNSAFWVKTVICIFLSECQRIHSEKRTEIPDANLWKVLSRSSIHRKSLVIYTYREPCLVQTHRCTCMSRRDKQRRVYVSRFALAVLLLTCLYVVSGNFHVNCIRSAFFFSASCYLLKDLVSRRSEPGGHRSSLSAVPETAPLPLQVKMSTRVRCKCNIFLKIVSFRFVSFRSLYPFCPLTVGVEVVYFHLITHRHTPQSVGLLRTRDRPVEETSTWQHKHSPETNIHAPGGIRTHDPSKRSAADPRLRSRGHWNRHS